jgi:hypothetical protein
VSYALVKIEGLSRRVPDPLARLMAKVRYTAYGCWEWDGKRFPTGYGKMRIGNPPLENCAHRWSYRLFKGPIPESLEIDHLCRNRCCVNPDHLEAVTHQENVRRGLGGKETGAMHRAKTHCRNGHPYSGDNLYLYPNGYRGCHTCNREAQKTYALRRANK